MRPLRRAARRGALLALALTLCLASAAPLWAQTVITTVPVGELPAGLAVDPITNRIYTADTNSDTSSIVDGATNTLLDEVAAGNTPFSVAVNPITQRVYVANFYGDDITVINAATRRVIGSIDVGDGQFT